MLQDVRCALRSFAVRPADSILVIGLLASGMAAGILAFCLADAILWHPVPFRDPERLVHIRAYHPAQPIQITVSPAALDAWSARPEVVSAVYFWSLASAVIDADGVPEAVSVAKLSPGLIRELGVPLVGRDIDAGDRGRRVVVLSHRMARARFGAPRDALGRNLSIDGESYTVIGIAPRAFEFPTSRVAAWLPEAPGPAPARVRAIARIRPELTFSRAAELAIASTRSTTAQQTSHELRLVPLTTTFPKTSQAVAVTIAASLALLLIGVVNAGNLLLADTVRRTGELAVRRSLGATTRALARQILVETCVRAIVAVAVALLVVSMTIDAVAAGVPYILTYQSMRPVTLDWRAVTFAAGIAIAVAGVASVAPCLRLAHVDVQQALQNSAASATPRARARSTLTVLQIAATLALTTAAGLLVNGVIRLVHLDAGYEADGLTVVELVLPRWRYTNPRATAAHLRALREAVEAIPGVTAATIADGMPPRMSFMAEGNLETSDGVPFADSSGPLNFATVDGRFLSTLRIPITAGRELDDADDVPQAVVSSSLASRLWPGRPAVGQTFRLSDSDSWLTVVGVCRDVMLGALDDQLGTRAVFLNRAASQDPPPQSGAPIYRNLVVRSEPPAAVTASALRATISRFVPGSPVIAIRSAREVITAQYARVRFVTNALAVLALVGVVMSMLGVYAAIRCSVTERRREIGVRLAIGADPRRIVGMVVSDCLRLVGAAVALGIPLAWASSTLLKPLLFEVTPADPITMTAVVVALTSCAVASSYLPARRAGAIDPVETLRAQ